MKKGIKKAFASVLISALILAQTLTGGMTAMAAETNTGAQLYENGLSETVEGGAILHCWCWNFNTIKEKMPEIAAAGFSAIQTSPICEVNNGGDGSLTISGGDNWWWHYQPTDYKIGNYQFGTAQEFKEMCDEAHSYGIKVIVDSVLNHTTAYYDKISDNIKNLPGGAFHPMGDEREPGQNWSEVDRYEETQYDLSGLYELNTQNKAVQEYILNFLQTCVENGADGFRYDAAKLIELPDDTSEKYGNDFASDFWPTILQNGSYFQYGEDLQEGGRHSYNKDQAGYNDNDSSRLYAYQSQTYTDKEGGEHKMNTTNSYTGFRIRDAVEHKNLEADFVTDAMLPEGAKANQTVTWVESHDNYCNDKSYTELTTTQQVIQGWALIAARKDGTPLFFDRPNNSSVSNPYGDNKIGPEGSDMYKDPQVAAVNFFRNEMGNTAQKATNPIAGNTQVVMIERGDNNKGVVIINASDEDVTINADTTMNDGKKMADGTYTDQAFKGEFTVTNGVLSGTVKAGKVAVVYNSNIDESSKETFEPAVNLSEASGYYLTDTLSTDVSVRSCDHAEYTLKIGENTTTGTVKAGDTIVISGAADGETATLTLTGYDSNNESLATVTREYTRWVKKDNTVVYMEREAQPDWNQCYVYIWGTAENAGWPGEEAELTEQGLYKYVLPYQYELEGSTGNVIFNSGNGLQFDAGVITPGQQMVYTADGQWKAYDAEQYSKPSVSLSEKAGYIPTDAQIKAYVKNCDHATYSVSVNYKVQSTGSVEYGDVIPMEFKHLDNIKVVLTGYNADNTVAATTTVSYRGWEKQNDTIIYMEQGAQPTWAGCNAYIWGTYQNASWPGVEMTKVGDVYKYVLPYQYELEGASGNVIFNYNGQQFDAGVITPGQKMIYTADGKWIPYEEPVQALIGDVNGDNNVDVLDAAIVQKYAAGKQDLTEALLYVADVNDDNNVDVLDAAEIQKYAAGIISEFKKK